MSVSGSTISNFEAEVPAMYPRRILLKDQALVQRNLRVRFGGEQRLEGPSFIVCGYNIKIPLRLEKVQGLGETLLAGGDFRDLCPY